MSDTQREKTFDEEVRDLEALWRDEERWHGIRRDYTAEEVVELRGSMRFSHPEALHGAERLWKLLHQDEPVRTFGALTGSQAVQMVKAGLKAIYVSGWQIAGDANLALQTYPDQSLYPVNSAPTLVRADHQRPAAGGPGGVGHRAPSGSGTGWRRSSPTPRPASAARSTPSS